MSLPERRVCKFAQLACPGQSRVLAAAKRSVRKLEGGVLKTGYLTKLGGNKSGAAGNWKRRFMVLTDELLYYEDEAAYLRGEKPKGEVKLGAICCPTPDDAREHFTDAAVGVTCSCTTAAKGESMSPIMSEFGFTLYALPYEFTCKAETQAEMLEWVEVFQKLPLL
mgnify:CR=1 FL=1